MRESKNKKTINNGQNGLRQRIIDKNDVTNGYVDGDKSKCVSHPLKSPPTQLQKIGSALFYAVCSICIVFVNKSVLTIYHFPSAQILGNSFPWPWTSPDSGCPWPTETRSFEVNRSNWKRYGSNDRSSVDSWNAKSNWEGWFSRFFKRYSEKSFSPTNSIFVQYGVRINVHTGTWVIDHYLWVRKDD